MTDELKQNTAPIPLDALKPKMYFEGTIIKTELFGALVDIGTERPGLLHISQMQVEGQDRIKRVANVFSAGSKVKVWVKDVDIDDGLVNLTMIEPRRYEWGDLKTDLQVEGKVTSVTDFGAFVSFGGPRDGLVPAGQLSPERINRPSDVVSEGDEVVAWVTNVDRRRERIGLSMIEPPELAWDQVRKGHTYRGKVTRLERFGAFVDIGAERDGLIHVSELAPGFVEDPSEVVTVGEEVEVKVLDIDRRKRQIQLSLKEIEAAQAEMEEEEELLPTSMEQAFRSAQKDSSREEAGAQDSKGEERQRREQIEILQRTLKQHRSRD